MNGREVFKHAVRRFPEVILEGLDYNGFTLDDVKLVIPHQANLRITQTVQKKLGISDDKIFSLVSIVSFLKFITTSIGVVPPSFSSISFIP